MKVEIGMRFERLIVVSLIPHRKNPKALCVCDCGATVTPQRGALVNGRAKSCGCLRREKLKEAATTHGKSSSSLYKRWMDMKNRCLRKADPAYKNYGGRGIKISERWMDFANFFEDMGNPPPGATLERKDTNGDYCKENCVWAGWKDQATNKRVSKRWVIHGVEYKSSVEAARALGVDASVINRRTNGRFSGGKWYPPHPGYESRLVYEPCNIDAAYARWAPVRDRLMNEKGIEL